MCVKVEVAVLGSPSLNSPYGLCGRKATFQEGWESEIRSCVCVCVCVCVKVEVAVLGSTSLNSPYGPCRLKAH